MRAALAVLVAVLVTGWAVWIAAAPALAAEPRSRPAAWASAVAYRVGAMICHQLDTRSLHVDGLRMPVCARCFGLYAGGAAGAFMAALWIVAARRAPILPLARWRVVAVACGIPTLAAWAGEHVAGVAVSGAARAVLAMPLGAAVAAIVTLWSGGAAFEDTTAGSALHS